MGDYTKSSRRVASHLQDASVTSSHAACDRLRGFPAEAFDYNLYYNTMCKYIKFEYFEYPYYGEKAGVKWVRKREKANEIIILMASRGSGPHSS